MPIERSISPDLKDSRLCDTLKHGDEPFTDLGRRAQDRSQQGYDIVPNSTKDLGIASQRVLLPLYLSRTCAVRSPVGRLMFVRDVEDVMIVEAELTIFSVLYFRNGLSNTRQNTILSAYKQYGASDADRVESDLVRQGVDISDYQVDLNFRLRIMQRQPAGRERVQAFLDQLNYLRDRYGQIVYVAKETGQTQLSCVSNWAPQQPDDVIQVPDVNYPGDAIKEHERERASQQGCDGFEVTEFPVGTAFQYPEYKWEWDWQRLQIGGCWTWVYVPTVFTRTHKEILVGYAVTAPEIKRVMEKAIRDCIEASAIATGVLALVTGGMGIPAAATAFITACEQCLEAKLQDTAKCVYPDLKLVAEIGQWVHL